MKTTIDLKRRDGSVIFSYTHESNTVAQTLQAYINLHYTKPKVETKIDLRDLLLRGDTFEGLELHNIDFTGASLQHCDFSECDLRNVTFAHANLNRCDFMEANMLDSDFTGTDLRNAIISRAVLRNVNFTSADLSEANLSYTFLDGINFTKAMLCGTNFFSADIIDDVDFTDVVLNENTIGYFPVCPTHGSFIGYKIADRFLITLLIPEDALRSSGTSFKCRCSKAKVIGIENLDGTPAKCKQVRSNYDYNFVYKLGETVEVKNFETNHWRTCSPGIHFYMSRELALNRE